MNMKYLGAAIVGLIILAALFSQGFALSLWTDLDLDKQEVQSWLVDKEGEIIEYLNRSEFPKPTNNVVEIYELKVENDIKAKARVDWHEREITLLDEDNREDAHLTVHMSEGTYKEAIDRFKAAVEDDEKLSSISFYMELVTDLRTDVDDEDGQYGDAAYKTAVIVWVNSEHENLKESYEENREDV